MSKDIRSFFLPKKPPKPTLEDEDVIPESPEVAIQKKKKSRNKRVLSDESDEEIFTTKKKKNDTQSIKNNKQVSLSKKPALKEVKAEDIFGSTPIKRTEPNVKKVKKNTETGIHSDEEFDKSLCMLDELELATSVNKNSNKTSDNHETNSKNKQDTSKTGKSNEDNKPKTNPSKLDQKKAIVNLNNSKDDPEHPLKKGKKRSFDEFVNDDSSFVEDEQKNSKKKFNNSLNESALTDEERHERKVYSAALYQKYLNRSGPKHLGAKEIPQGSPNCLNNCAFLLTGVLDSFERDEIVEAITKFGGTIKNSISKKVTHVLAGEDAGPAKMAKAQELGIKIINEDEFLTMISNSESNDNKDTPTKKGTKSSKKEAKSAEKRGNIDVREVKKSVKDAKSAEKAAIKKERKTPVKKDKAHEDSKTEQNNKKSEVKSSHEHNNKIKQENGEMEPTTSKSINKSSVNSLKTEKQDTKHVKDKIEKSINKTETVSKTEYNKIEPGTSGTKVQDAVMWVDKYKPQNVKQIIGQHGDASNVKKLINWLTKWYVNRKAKLPKPSPWAKNDDGAYYKAALLSGPPGVGKTTTVSLVCKELGFDMVEFNASDTRSKNLIKEQISELLTTTSLSGYAKGEVGKQAVTKKHVLVMDEVDGMAGNEDRGGLQELISLIKLTSIPIICMCNDRNSQKMRSLVNYCYDLRFSKPRVDQIKAAMLTICFKEGIKIPPDALTQLIVACNQDIRQTLNSLSMWATQYSDVDSLKRDANGVKKDIKLGPWEAIRKVFSAEDHKKMSINDKSDLFFYDYSLAPLFVQENYLGVTPHCPKNEILKRISIAADSISLGDIVEAKIRGSQAWSLLPVQAMYSSVIPGHAMSGHVSSQIQFPGWLGKNSRKNKMHRLCQEVHAHTRLSTSGSKSSIYLDYCSHIRDAILIPLVKDKVDGIQQSLSVLESYHLLREDLDSLIELSSWPGQKNIMMMVDSKVKAAMTRSYNKSATALPYAPGSIKKVKAKDDDAFAEEGDEIASEEEHDSDPEADALIKKKNTKNSEKDQFKTDKGKASTSKEKPVKERKKKK